MATQSDVIVIGGGVMGLSVGYNLAKKGLKTLILEGDYMNAGSTGRNMGVIKERIPHAIEKGNEDLIRIAVKGLNLHARLPSKLGYNTFYRRSGCLLIAKDEDELKQLLEHHSRYQELGLRESLMNPEKIEKRWPYIDSSNLIMGLYDPREAIVHPFGVTWAYLESIKKLGGRVEKQNRVKMIRKTVGGFKIIAEGGEYEAENAVIACGAHSSELPEQLGFEIPLTPWRKEVLISEPMRPFLGPVLERLQENYQVAQTMRGEILGTMGFMPPSFDLSECTSDFLYRFAEETVRLIPSFKHLRIIRQWVGICDMTPDLMPIVGQLDEGLYIMCGNYDYGITLAPIVGQLLADNIVRGKPSPLLKAFDPHRFT